jgi:hypothetical protein
MRWTFEVVVVIGLGLLINGLESIHEHLIGGPTPHREARMAHSQWFFFLIGGLGALWWKHYRVGISWCADELDALLVEHKKKEPSDG